jgi:hypothetical protein
MSTTAVRSIGICASGLSSEKAIYLLIAVATQNDRESI